MLTSDVHVYDRYTLILDSRKRMCLVLSSYHMMVTIRMSVALVSHMSQHAQ